ncbi:MAG: MBL fold metallo-hydrolase [Candidatus Saccharimonadales bacterium]
MDITKYEHACLDIKQDNQRLIIDPGGFTALLTDFSNVCAVVITHQHADHLNPELLQKIANGSPKVKIFTAQDVVSKLDRALDVTEVSNGSYVNIGPFNLKFFGGEHATIHSSYPAVQNVGVMINDKLYYPGDALLNPGVSVEVLAVPAHAPWMKTSETIDFILAIKPKKVFPTHNGFINQDGHDLYKRLLGSTVESVDGEYIDLSPGSFISV